MSWLVSDRMEPISMRPLVVSGLVSGRIQAISMHPLLVSMLVSDRMVVCQYASTASVRVSV